MEKTLSKYDLINRYSVFVFDLDNTLYDENDYLFCGYKFIAEYVATKHNNFTSKDYYDYLTMEFNLNGREGLFDKFIAHFNIPVQMNELLDILHSHHSTIQLNKNAKEFIDLILRQKKKIYILTNGNIKQQQNKVKLLELNSLYPNIKILYASAIKPKPSPLAMQMIIAKENSKVSDVLFIGDSNVDELTAKNANVDFIYIQNITI